MKKPMGRVTVREGGVEDLLTQQEQFHLSGRLFSIFPQVFIDHFRPLGRGFIFLTNRAAHGSQCSLQVCSLVGKYHPRKKNDSRASPRSPSLDKKTHARTQGLKLRETTSLFDECQQRRRVPLIRQQGAELGLSGLGISGGAAGCSLARSLV